MTLTLELSPELERALSAKARRAGVPLQTYVLDLARREAQEPGASAPGEDPFFAELDDLAQQFPIDAPPLADDAVASIYEAREASEP